MISRNDATTQRSCIENELATLALGICFDIHRQYGPGLFESVYETIFCHELSKKGIEYKSQCIVPLIHDGVKLDLGFRADIIINDKLLVEFKSVEKLADVHFKQVLTYLKLTNIRLGLLVNFNASLLKDGIHRIANNLS